MASLPTNQTAETTSQDIIVVSTKRFGDLSISTDKVITMASPILGFPDSKRFFLRPHSPKSPFMWFQAIEEPDLAFVVVRAAAIAPDYKPSIPGVDRKELGLESDEEIDLLLLLTVPQSNPRDMTANLLGPLIINVTNRRAKQVLLDPSKYDSCWQVFIDD